MYDRWRYCLRVSSFSIFNSSIELQGLQNQLAQNRCYVNTVLQCLASFNLVDSPCGSTLSWILYYLTHSHIKVKAGDLNEKVTDLLENFENGTTYRNRPGDPADILHHLFPMEITSNHYGTLGR